MSAVSIGEYCEKVLQRLSKRKNFLPVGRDTQQHNGAGGAAADSSNPALSDFGEQVGTETRDSISLTETWRDSDGSHVDVDNTNTVSASMRTSSNGNGLPILVMLSSTALAWEEKSLRAMNYRGFSGLTFEEIIEIVIKIGSDPNV
jgi:hypothetical protein